MRNQTKYIPPVISRSSKHDFFLCVYADGCLEKGVSVTRMVRADVD